MAARVANAYVEQLRDIYASFDRAEANERHTFYQGRAKAERGELTVAELRFEESARTNRPRSPEAQAGINYRIGCSYACTNTTAEAQLGAMRLYETRDNPDLQRAQAELAGLRMQLAKLLENSNHRGDRNSEIPF